MLGIGKSSAQVNRPQLCDRLEKIVQVSCGIKHSLFLDVFGNVFAAGSNKLGRLGIGHENGRGVQYFPVKVCIESKIQQVAAGNSHSLFLTQREGLVYACGDNSNGQLG